MNQTQVHAKTRRISVLAVSVMAIGSMLILSGCDSITGLLADSYDVRAEFECRARCQASLSHGNEFLTETIPSEGGTVDLRAEVRDGDEVVVRLERLEGHDLMQVGAWVGPQWVGSRGNFGPDADNVVELIFTVDEDLAQGRRGRSS